MCLYDLKIELEGKLDFKIPEDTQLLTWMFIGLVSAWGGLVRYIIDVKNDKAEWRWIGFVFQVIISGFTGMLGGLLSFEIGSSIYITCVIAGLFGAIGSGSIELIANRVLFRNGIK